MADTRSREPVQQAHSSNYVSFGHFGTGTYDTKTHTWSFLRQPSLDSSWNAAPFRLVRDPVVVSRAAATSTKTDNATAKPIAIPLLKSAPEGAHAAIQYAREVALTAERRCKDVGVTCLAFGSALLLGSNDAQSGLLTIPIVAVVNPDEPSRLCLQLLGSEVAQVDVDLERPLDVKLPSLQNQASTLWTTNGDTIKQVHFSGRSSSQGDTWLAVRRACAINIFQPLFHRTEATTHTQYPSTSSLDINQIVELSCLHTGGPPIADLAFNPHNPRDLAVVDVEGNWSIWRIRGTRSRSAHVLHRIELIVQGSMVSQPQCAKQFDGWHRVLWLTSGGDQVDRLLICNRQSIALWDLHGGKVLEVDAQVGLKGGRVLDIATTSTDSEVFVLTTLFLFSITTAGNGDLLGSSHDDLTVLAYWSHSRGLREQPLRLTTLQHLGDVWLFLSCESDSVMTIYQWSKASIRDSDSCRVSDAVGVCMPKHLESGFSCLSAIVVAAETDRTQQHLISDRLFKLFVRNRNGDIVELLYWFQRPKSGGHSTDNVLLLSKQQLTQHRSTYRIARGDADGDVAHFVAPDDEVDPSDQFEETNPDALASQVLGLTLDQGEENTEPRIRDLTRTYAILLRDNEVKQTKAGTTMSTFVEAVEQMATKTPEQSRSSLVSELPITLPYVAEIEEDSQILATQLRERRELRGLSGPNDEPQGSLIDIYDELAETWMSSLSQGVSDRARVQRERLLRQVALEAFLANITTESFSRASSSTQRTPQNSDATVIASPARTGSSRYDPSILADDASSPVEDLQSETQQRPILSLYTTYRNADESSTVVDQILAHLPDATDVDANPDAYSHNDVELNLALKRNDAASQELDPRSRRRAEKLMRARRRQFEKQNQTRQAALEQRMAVPSVLSSSQLPLRDVQSSQTAAAAAALGSSQPGQNSDGIPQLISMTQPERGAYGMRDGKKIKAKGKAKVSRQKGF